MPALAVLAAAVLAACAGAPAAQDDPTRAPAGRTAPAVAPPSAGGGAHPTSGRPGPSAITLAFAGDTQAHGVAGRVNEHGLGEAGRVLAQADLAMVNLETVVAEDTSGLVPQPKPFTFVTDPRILTTLRQSGVDVVTVANNHGMDFGQEGMARMLRVKASSPLPMVGLGKDEREAWAPWVTSVRGRRVVVLGATDVLDAHLDWKATATAPGLAKVKDDSGMAGLLEGVRAARASGPDTVVVVYLHSGIEKQRCPTPRQRETARLLSAAGATVVVGSHAHITQTTTRVGETAVAYGLGNFVFGSGSPETTETGVLTVSVPSAGPPALAWSPARIEGGLPRLLHGAERDRGLRRWERRGEGCPDVG